MRERLSVTPRPGELVAIGSGDTAVAVANVDGTLYAFEDTCTHEECSLAEGELDGHVVICDCHGGEFDVRTGEPLGGPVLVPLRTYRVLTIGNDVVVETDAEADSAT